MNLGRGFILNKASLKEGIGNMKVVIFIIILSIITASATIGFTYNKKVGESVNPILVSKGIPEHGLAFIEPTDVYYQELMKKSPRNRTDSDFETLKPISVLLKNNNQETLIAFQLKWEIVDINGQIITITNGYTNSRRLFDIDDKSKTKSVLEPNDVMLCSAIDVSPIDQPVNDQGSNLTFTPVLRSNNEEPQQESYGKSRVATTDLLTRLSEALKITVFIDGALFMSGKFVGADSCNFYGYLNSLIESKRDLIKKLKDLQQNVNPNKVQETLEEEIKVPQVNLGPNSTSDDFYRVNRKRFAQRLLILERNAGYDAIRKELEISNNQWINLRKF